MSEPADIITAVAEAISLDLPDYTYSRSSRALTRRQKPFTCRVRFSGNQFNQTGHRVRFRLEASVHLPGLVKWRIARLPPDLRRTMYPDVVFATLSQGLIPWYERYVGEAARTRFPSCDGLGYWELFDIADRPEVVGEALDAIRTCAPPIFDHFTDTSTFAEQALSDGLPDMNPGDAMETLLFLGTDPRDVERFAARWLLNHPDHATSYRTIRERTLRDGIGSPNSHSWASGIAFIEAAHGLDIASAS